MQGVYLKMFVSQTAKHGGKLLYEWLLEEAHRSGIGGGTATRCIAGFGRHGHLHEEHFFELADDLPVAVEFIAGESQIEQLLGRIATENISLFYLRHAVEFATT
jgi:PII-like signaling protein